jgi:hypothetical protein
LSTAVNLSCRREQGQAFSLDEASKPQKKSVARHPMGPIVNIPAASSG